MVGRRTDRPSLPLSLLPPVVVVQLGAGGSGCDGGRTADDEITGSVCLAAALLREAACFNLTYLRTKGRMDGRTRGPTFT